MSLKGQVALVTGASRGIGRGIALQLGEAGATVYVTGRPEQAKANAPQFELPSLEQTAREVTARGGKGIAAYCDHSNPADIEQLFARIKTEQHGQLDILVNNAYAAVAAIQSSAGKKFYETDPNTTWEVVNNVGLKNHYLCTVYGARLMVPRESGLIIMISSFGGMNYLFNVAYGIGKAACDRLAADVAMELASKKVTSVSLWPGAVKTEIIQNTVLRPDVESNLKSLFEHGESTEYVGKAVVALACDPNHLDKSGRILTTEALAKEYKFTERDGSTPSSNPAIQEIRDKYLEHLNAIRAPKLH